MHQETILLLDGDESARNEHLQRLQEAGYLVQERLNDRGNEDHLPELVVASMPLTRAQQKQIEELTQRKRRPLLLFLLSEERPQDATEALELGADDILRRPVSTHELRARLRLLADRRRRDNLGRPGESGEGNINEVPIAELLRQFSIGHGTATVQLQSGSHRGKLYFREGQLCGAVVDHYQGVNALIRALRWQVGRFVITPRLEEDRPPGGFDQRDPITIAKASAAKWDALIERLPPIRQSIQVDFPRVQQHLDDLNDLAEQLLWQLASHRSLEGVIDDLDGDPIEALTQLCHLYENNYFKTIKTSALSGVFSADAPSHSMEGVETGMAVRTQGGNFSNRLADAAKEAAAQLMAAAQPMVSVGDAHPDRFPSFEEMQSGRTASLSFDEAGFGPSRSSQSGANSHSHQDPLLFPLESPAPSPSGEMMLGPSLDIHIHGQDDELFELGDFKNLSVTERDLPLEPAPIDTTLPSLVAPKMEDLELGLPELMSLQSNQRSDDSLPSGEFQVDEPASKVASTPATSALAGGGTAILGSAVPDPQDGVRQMLQLETMDVLDKLLQTELSSIAEQEGVSEAYLQTPATSSTAVLHAEAPTPSSPPQKAHAEQRPAGMGLTMAYGPGVNAAESAKEARHSAKDQAKAPAKKAKPSLKESAPTGISLEAGMIGSKSNTSLSLDELPAQKGSFPSLSLSDEFFLKEEDLRPVKPNKVKTLVFYALGGIAFMVVGFLGMGWLAKIGKSTKTTQPVTRKIIKPMLTGTAPRPIVPAPIAPVRRAPKPLLLPTEQVNPDGGAPDAAEPPDVAPVAPRPVTPRPIAPRPVIRRPVVRRPVIRRPVVRRPVVRRPVVRRPVVRRPVVRRPVVASGGSDARATRLLRRALVFKQREKFGSAERLLRSALRLKPSQPAPIYSALGQVLYEREKTGPALRYLSKAYQISPKQTGPGLVTLGSIFYERKNRQRAKRIYLQYLKYFPRGKHADDVRAMLKN